MFRLIGLAFWDRNNNDFYKIKYVKFDEDQFLGTEYKIKNEGIEIKIVLKNVKYKILLCFKKMKTIL